MSKAKESLKLEHLAEPREESQRPQKRIPRELIEQLFAAAGGPDGLTGPGGPAQGRGLDAEMAHHLGYERGEEPAEDQSNRRNGDRIKRVRTDRGELEVEVPRTATGPSSRSSSPSTSAPSMVPLYSRGMSTRDIQRHLQELYGVDVSPDLISRVTDAVIDEMKEWQSRALEAVHPIVYIDALVVKIRDQGRVGDASAGEPVSMNTRAQKRGLIAVGGHGRRASMAESIRRRSGTGC